jgi:hypothetical protein
VTRVNVELKCIACGDLRKWPQARKGAAVRKDKLEYSLGSIWCVTGKTKVICDKARKGVKCRMIGLHIQSENGNT